MRNQKEERERVDKEEEVRNGEGNGAMPALVGRWGHTRSDSPQTQRPSGVGAVW